MRSNNNNDSNNGDCPGGGGEDDEQVGCCCRPLRSRCRSSKSSSVDRYESTTGGADVDRRVVSVEQKRTRCRRRSFDGEEYLDGSNWGEIVDGDIFDDDDENEVSFCLKYILFVVNSIVFLTGLFLVGASIWSWSVKTTSPTNGQISISDQIVNIIVQIVTDPVFHLFLVGIVSAVLGFAGCFGSLREKTCLLFFYEVAVVLILVVECAALILIVVFREQIRTVVSDHLKLMIAGYRDDIDRQNLIDWIQSDWLKCCGVDSPDDWDLNIYFNCSSISSGSVEACGVPSSCCRPNVSSVDSSVDLLDDKDSGLGNQFCGFDVRSADNDKNAAGIIYLEGCWNAFTNWLQTNIVVVNVGLTIVVLAELLSLALVQNMRTDIERQRAKWQFVVEWNGDVVVDDDGGQYQPSVPSRDRSRSREAREEGDDGDGDGDGDDGRPAVFETRTSKRRKSL